MKSSLWVAALFHSCFLMADLIPIQETFEPTGPFDPIQYGKVAVLAWNQSQSTPLGVSSEAAEAFKQRNREIIADFVKEAAAKGARMVITPEFSVVGYPYHPELPPEEDNFQSRDEIAPYVESVPGPSTVYFSALAKELGIYLHVGLAEVEAGTDKYFNTVVALDPRGEVVAKYRKIHLYKVESRFLSEGSTPVTYYSIFGKVGIVICSDIYSGFPMNATKTRSWIFWLKALHGRSGTRE